MNPFIQKYSGKVVSYDGVPADAGQCVQLVELYARDVLGVRLPLYPDAAAYWERPVPGYVKISKAHGLPQAGDIVVFDRQLQGSGGHGHMDICFDRVSRGGYRGFDSNWGSLKAQLVGHDYSHVLGYLRKSPGSVSPVKKVVQAVHAAISPKSYYVVRYGDNLSSISRRFGTPVNTIADWNGIKNKNLIYPNQRLRVK